jgi:uncharacterized membrane protein
MNKERLAAFSDGVIAIIITIMVLELKAPHGSGWNDLASLVPDLLSYALSFIYVAIYWNNHHHMLHTVHHVNGAILWANMHLLFWLSLIPFATDWVSENHFVTIPTAVYGVSLLLPAIAYFILQTTIIHMQGPHSALAKAIGKDIKGKVSPVLYLLGIGLSFVHPLFANTTYALVAVIWLIPDRRIERTLAKS